MKKKKRESARKILLDRIKSAAAWDDDAKYYRQISHVLNYTKKVLLCPGVFTGMV